MDATESLRRFGLNPLPTDLEQIRRLLNAQGELDEQDTILMRVLCLQLFNAGQPQDIQNIWQAKASSWDAHCAIDVQLLCGTGLESTRTHLAADGSAEALKAREYLDECVAAGDFDEFSVSSYSRTLGTSFTS